MKKYLLYFAILLLGLTTWQCSREGVADQPAPPQGVPVKSIVLHPRQFSEYINITGTLEARKHIQIIVEEPGILKRILRDKGSLVRQGDTLAILENKILEAGYREAKAAYHQSELEYRSREVLYQKKAISENEFLMAKYGQERARAAYELAKVRYSKLFIVAPISGYVNDRLYDQGAYAMTMTPLFDFIDNAHMKIRAGVAERFMNDIRIGTPVEISFDAYPDLRLRSNVSFINRSIDPMNRTFRVEIEIPNPGRRLAPEMVADLKLLRRFYENIIAIPLDAIIESENGRHVFVVENSRARKRPVEFVAVYQDSVVVNGLRANDSLVVTGHQELSDGDPLLIIND